jgi:hypothetical protein
VLKQLLPAGAEVPSSFESIGHIGARRGGGAGAPLSARWLEPANAVIT